MGSAGKKAIFGTAILLLVSATATPEPKPADDPIAALEASLPTPASDALLRIAEGGRRLLALRGYLRSERSLETRWSWTEEEIASYVASPEHDAALADIEKVRAAFEAANDGTTLRVNTEVRSLDEQISSWNRNKSVELAAGELVDDLDQWMDARPQATAAEVRNFFKAWRPSRPVSLAVPGLSPHGRGQAFDFQIERGAEIIAGADTRAVSDVWEKDGWTEKLKAAVQASGAPFVGPLQRPLEPWHYDYKPSRVSSVRSARGQPTDGPASAPPVPRPRPST